MQEQAVDGGGAAGLAEALAHDALQRHAQMRVMDEWFGGHRVVAGITDAFTRGTERLLAALGRPAQPVGRGSVGIEEQPLRVGGGDRLTRVGGGGLRGVSERARDVSRPDDALHRRAARQCFAKSAPDLGDAIALPGGGQDDRHAAESTGEQLGVDAQALLLGDVGLVEHEDDR